MNQVYKQMIVVLFSFAFVAIMVLIILSSIATASSVPIDTDMYDYETPPYNPDKGLITGIVGCMVIGVIVLVFTYKPTVPATDPNEYIGIDYRQLPDDTIDNDGYDYDNFMRKWE